MADMRTGQTKLGAKDHIVDDSQGEYALPDGTVGTYAFCGRALPYWFRNGVGIDELCRQCDHNYIKFALGVKRIGGVYVEKR